jgi:hypothetical protein
MSEPIKEADLKETPVPPADTEKKPEEKKPEAPQDPLKKELDDIKNKKEGRTQKEKLIYSKNRIEAQLRELEGEEETPENDDDDDENRTVTFKDLKEMEARKAVKTSLQLAEEISDETERELTKHHLENSIKSTGNPQEDLRLARAIVNAAKNAKIAEELVRKGKPKDHSSASSANANRGDQEEELTPEELQFMKPPFNMSKADIIKTRK